jgi:hypothetical protein
VTQSLPLNSEIKDLWVGRIFLPIVRRGGIAQFFTPTRIPRERAAGFAVELCSFGADKPKIEAV